MVTTFLTVRRRSRRVVKEIYLCFFFPTLRRNQKCVSTVANTCAKEKYWISGKLFFVSWKCWWTQWRWMIIKIDKNYRTYKILLYYSSFSFFFLKRMESLEREEEWTANFDQIFHRFEFKYHKYIKSKL